MSLFGNNKKKELPPLLSEAELELEPAVNYNSVVEWLVGLPDEDLAKVTKVVDINRKAYAETCGVLGLEVEPSSFITPPEPEENIQAVHADHNKPKSFLDDDEPGFLMDDIAPTSKTKKGRKVTVKNAKN